MGTGPRRATKEERFSLNNNRNNRRRGRGNRNQGGGNAANRIDSRARGNAPQLLDKYKKLAQDAQHNGDRVQAEYYLQFADHYFRVIADNKARQDEARAKRDSDRGPSDDDDDSDDDGDDRRKGGRKTRARRDDRDQDKSQDKPQGKRRSRSRDDDESDTEGERYEPDDNPFTPEEKPKKRAPRKRKEEAAEIDASALPPSIKTNGGGHDDGADDEDAKPKPKPAPRRRSRRSSDSDQLSVDS